MYVIYSKFSIIIIIITNFFSFLFQKFMNLILSSMCRFRCVLQWNFSSSTSLPWTFLNGNNEKKKSRERQSYKKLFDNIYIYFINIYIFFLFFLYVVCCVSLESSFSACFDVLSECRKRVSSVATHSFFLFCFYYYMYVVYI
jgi:hypothetical protein